MADNKASLKQLEDTLEEYLVKKLLFNFQPALRNL